MARIALGLRIRELAALAKVSPDTVARLERGEELKARTVDALRRALESAGVEFIPENGGGLGVRLRNGGARGDAGAALAVEDLNSENDE